MRDKSNIPFSFLKYEHPTYYFQLFRKEVIFLFLIVKDIELLINTVIITAIKLQKRNFDFEWKIKRAVYKKKEEHYRHQVFEKNLRCYIVFSGAFSHSETLQKITDADIYNQTSRSEGLCNLVLEIKTFGKYRFNIFNRSTSRNIQNNKLRFLRDDLSAEQLAIVKVLVLLRLDLSNYIRFAVRWLKENSKIEKQQQAFQTNYLN